MTTKAHQSEGSQEQISTEQFARMAVDIASERLGSDITLLDIAEVSDFADYFIIVSGETGRHLDAISNDIQRGLREKGLRPLHREGTGPGGWILLDYGAVVVHVFDRETRERYDLERLWSRGREIVRLQ